MTGARSLVEPLGTQTMKILPMMHRGVALVHDDGVTIEMAPMQIWRQKNGTTVLRLGRNTFYFNDDGTYDGSEHAMNAGSPQLEEALKISAENRGLAPDTPYFPPGSPGHAEETRAWPSAKHQAGGKVYEVHGRTPEDGSTH